MIINNFIYFHIALCIFLIVVELLWHQYMKIRDYMINKKEKQYFEQINEYISKGFVDDDYLQLLKKELRRTDNLIAMEQAYSRIIKEDSKKIYIVNVAIDIFKDLTRYYNKKKNETEKAYYAYLIGEFFYKIKNKKNRTFFIKFLYEWLMSKSTYTRINALDAICKIGSTSDIIRALDIINVKEYNYSNQLLAYELKNVQKRREKLANELFKKFENYNKNIQMAIINYLSENSYINDNLILEKLMNDKFHVDVKCEILRYFQKNKNESLKNYLLNILNSENIIANDLIIKAIGTLGYYNEIEVEKILQKLTEAKDDLIKETAYRSLEKMKNIRNIELLEVLEV